AFDVADFVVVLVNQQKSGFGATAVDSEIAHLPSPARRTTRFPEIVFKVGDSPFRVLRLFLGIVQLLLSVRDFRAEPILAIVDIALTEKLRVQILYLQIEKDDVILG